ncbi:uncharacterized protein MYCFIDRAFT_76962 [Pseudocercospora fijiensis CIRAD86]|uniref:Uncharacterized protein n=1 Tax=Pseudocercospora fijiensis (strain CIRAD86) TaxID=383855 RepID=M3A8S3_PSEFD|nr:uncharacterized protein MYCFIDRAFT_76962 [Pseudocercospora fijiensis CIRAD86]EME81026.1 hypothetical protein MYCFIDRAFT_76962 [Pseudocercospora fijiensis CIRAD86]
MRYLTPILAALAVGIAAVPVPAQTAPSQPCPSTALKQSQSVVFGWQLAGSAANAQDLDQTCSHLQSSANQATTWSQLGLLTTTIQTPVCNALEPNAETALVKLSAANTKVFTTLLTSSFDQSNKSTFSYLCDNIRYVQLNGFLLDSATIVNATCQLGADSLHPQPFTTIGGATANQTAVEAYNDAQSKLFAYTYAASATSTDQLQTFCANSAQPVRQGRFDQLQLDASCVKSTICSVKSPLSVDDAKAQFTKWTSMGFLAVIQNLTNQPGYLKWLCHNLDVGGMDGVGLDGKLVKAQRTKNQVSTTYTR